ncbi:MAG: citrate lyase holo-[Firmicutes bacterium]|nr:citrate lyase holo-[acyl-carrier protein] synthase [Bacillota bacterium]
MEVTLKELLDSREERVWLQQKLLEEYGNVLVSVTLNIPGPVKDKPEYRKVMTWGMNQLVDKFADEVLYSEIKFPKTGAEGYICLGNLDVLEAKKIAVSLEEREAKARLLDIDVMTKERTVSRHELGLAPRKCLICQETAKICARSQKHSMEELLAKVEELCYDE